MSDEYGVYHRSDGGTGWFVAIVVALALLAIGYMIFNANERWDPKVTEKQAACMIAHPGMSCEQVTRWEPIVPQSSRGAR